MSERRWTNFSQGMLVAGLVLLTACIVVLSLVPPVEKDALVHHLAVPKLYLKHGGMYEIPFMPYSYYPMNLHLLYILPLYFGNDMIPKFIHFLFALFTAVLIFTYLKRHTKAVYGIYGALFFLSIPIILKLSITVYVDLGVIFFSSASLLLLLRWMESRFKTRFLVLSGIMCGLALGTKYNALVALFILTMIAPFVYVRWQGGKRPGFIKSTTQGLIFFFVALIVFSPWMIRNYQWKKNPIYPLYQGWFSALLEPLGEERVNEGVEKSSAPVFTYRKVIYGEETWEIALLPLRVFFQGEDGKPQCFDGKLNPFLLCLSLLAFFRWREDSRDLRRHKIVMLAFVFLFFAFSFFSTDLRIRYISPILPPLVILSVLGLKKVADLIGSARSGATKVGGKIIFLFLTVTPLTLNADYVLSQFREVDPFGYLGGKWTREAYISHFRPEYPAIEYINQHLAPDALVWFVFVGGRGYYCDRNYVHAESEFGRIVMKAESAEGISSTLMKSGVTHLLIHDALFLKWVNENVPEQTFIHLQGFLSTDAQVTFTENDFTLLSVGKPRP